MYLKNFQIKVVNEYKRFFQTAKYKKDFYLKLPDDEKKDYNWVNTTFNALGKPNFSDNPKNGLNEFYPRVCVKIPTGGGKTVLAVEAIREYQNLFSQKKTGLIIWIVPSETIYSQTVKKLKDKSDFYRQLLDQSSGGNTLILEKGQKITIQDIQGNLVILFLMIQSVNRKNAKESLKVFEDSGGYESFFPEDNRYDLHKELIIKVPNLDVFSGVDSFQPQVKTSLGNIIRLTNPLMIIDEIHKVFSPLAKQTIDNLNPAMILGFSATPKEEMNILINITGTELKDEEMIKLDMHLKPPLTTLANYWQSMLKEIKTHREKLETTAISFQKGTGRYIRPIALIQVERTGKDQRGHGFVHSLDVKDFLVQLQVPDHQIAIKTSSQNDIEDLDLLSEDCEIRYIITKEALKEGWDCPFSYVLGIIPNVNSNTGTTQLVGRILRQPYVQKTGIKNLDESYVYFVSGQTQNILSQIKQGFERDGLEDLFAKVHTEGLPDTTITKTTKIKDKYKTKYPESLYLPIWLIKNMEKNILMFNYDLDIKPYIDYYRINYLSDDWIENILKPSLSQQKGKREGAIITIDKTSHTVSLVETEEVQTVELVDINYFTRRLNEYWDNPFSARKHTLSLLTILDKKVEKKELDEHFGFIVSQICVLFQKEKERQEQEIFQNYLNDKRLILAVADSENIGFTIPDKDTISVEQYNPYQNYLFDDMELRSLNILEKSVADTLDRQDKILWWFRNKATHRWYAIQGWQRQKIRPDFVAARKTADDKLELVYVLESKGTHLLGNEDTLYKEQIFKLMNNAPIQIVNSQKTYEKINNKVRFILSKEEDRGSIEREIRTLFN